ncbi:MAG TPA: hypothetical protein VH914_12505 [Acidimicrobiia bacterium]|jgi:hypothetical protein|nr:hypothetical protein [Acidimicrobiia bacterium]
MRRTFSRGLVIGIALLTLAGPTIASAAPAGAADGGCPASCIAGHYSIHFKWADSQRWIVYPLDLYADHTGNFACGGLQVTWTKKNNTFTMAFDYADDQHGAYVGFRNGHDGFDLRHRKGTMSNTEGNTGVWFARAADPVCPSRASAVGATG